MSLISGVWPIMIVTILIAVIVLFNLFICLCSTLPKCKVHYKLNFLLLLLLLLLLLYFNKEEVTIFRRSVEQRDTNNYQRPGVGN